MTSKKQSKHVDVKNATNEKPLRGTQAHNAILVVTGILEGRPHPNQYLIYLGGGFKHFWFSSLFGELI